MPDEVLISVKAGVAVARALESLGVAARLKWPNDLVTSEIKHGGILIEVIDDLALVGIGLNLSSSPLDGVACLDDFHVQADRDLLLEAIYLGLARVEPADEVLATYRARSATLGRCVSVNLGHERRMVGRAIDIDSAGHLVVETASGPATIAAGDCFHLRDS